MRRPGQPRPPGEDEEADEKCGDLPRSLSTAAAAPGRKSSLPPATVPPFTPSAGSLGSGLLLHLADLKHGFSQTYQIPPNQGNVNQVCSALAVPGCNAL